MTVLRCSACGSFINALGECDCTRKEEFEKDVDQIIQALYDDGLEITEDAVAEELGNVTDKGMDYIEQRIEERKEELLIEKKFKH